MQERTSTRENKYKRDKYKREQVQERQVKEKTSTRETIKRENKYKGRTGTRENKNKERENSRDTGTRDISTKRYKYKRYKYKIYKYNRHKYKRYKYKRQQVQEIQVQERRICSREVFCQWQTYRQTRINLFFLSKLFEVQQILSPEFSLPLPGSKKVSFWLPFLGKLLRGGDGGGGIYSKLLGRNRNSLGIVEGGGEFKALGGLWGDRGEDVHFSVTAFFECQKRIILDTYPAKINETSSTLKGLSSFACWPK